MAGGLGFEPRLAESESAVLPLDDPPKTELGATVGLKTTSCRPVEEELGRGCAFKRKGNS